MEVLKAQTKRSKLASLKLNQLDLNTLGMVIKGVWTFKNNIDEVQLKSSIIELLAYYPQLSGRIKDESEIVLNNSGILYSVSQKSMSIYQVEKNANYLDDYNPGLNVKALKKGSAELLSIQLVKMNDGCVLSIHCAHACMDGNSFFKMVHDLSDLYNRKTISSPELYRPDTLENIPDKEKAQKLMKEKGWKSVPFTALFQFLWQQIIGVQKNVSSPIFISEKYLQSLHEALDKKGNNVGQHALLSAILVKLCQKLNNTGNSACSQVSVIDLRGRLDIFSSSYIGNAVTTITASGLDSTMSITTIATKIKASITDFISDSSLLREHVLLNMAASKYKVPYTPFDLKAMNSKKPTCFYINNLLKFDIYDIDFGGTPVAVLPNDLPDAIKIWPSSPENPGIKVYFRGYLAKRFNKIKTQKEWVESFLKDVQQEI